MKVLSSFASKNSLTPNDALFDFCQEFWSGIKKTSQPSSILHYEINVSLYKQEILICEECLHQVLFALKNQATAHCCIITHLLNTIAILKMNKAWVRIILRQHEMNIVNLDDDALKKLTFCESICYYYKMYTRRKNA